MRCDVSQQLGPGGAAALDTPGLVTGDGDDEDEDGERIEGVHDASELKRSIDEYIRAAREHLRERDRTAAQAEELRLEEEAMTDTAMRGPQAAVRLPSLA